MKNLKKLLLIVTCLSTVICLTSCEKESVDELSEDSTEIIQEAEKSIDDILNSEGSIIIADGRPVSGKEYLNRKKSQAKATSVVATFRAELTDQNIRAVLGTNDRDAVVVPENQQKLLDNYRGAFSIPPGYFPVAIGIDDFRSSIRIKGTVKQVGDPIRKPNGVVVKIVQPTVFSATRDRALKLKNITSLPYAVSSITESSSLSTTKTDTSTRSYEVGASIKTTVEPSILGISFGSVEVSANTSTIWGKSSSNSTTEVQSESRTLATNLFLDGNKEIPKGKKCEVSIVATPFKETTTYTIEYKVGGKGNLIGVLESPSAGARIYRRVNDVRLPKIGIKAKIRYVVKDKVFVSSTVVKNCRNL